MKTEQRWVIIYSLQGSVSAVTAGDDSGDLYCFPNTVEVFEWLMERERSLRLTSACDAIWVLNIDTGEVEAF